MERQTVMINQRLKFALFLLLAASISAYSQNDTLFKAIASYKDTTSQFIGNARGLMLLKFNEGDFKTVSDLKKFLQKSENKDYIFLYPLERWLLDYTLEEYDDIVKTVLQFDSAYYASFSYKVRPAYDLLEKKLIDYFLENRSKQEIAIDHSNLEMEKKEFLKLNLHYILFITKEPLNYRDTLNKLANSFIAAYPHSDYVPYVKKNIRYELGPADFGFGMNLGFGVRLNAGSIKNTIDEGIVLDFGLVFTYRKWDYDLHILVGPVQLQKDLPVKDKVWPKGASANYLNCEFSVAHDLLNHKKHKLSPSLGLAITEFSPYQDSINQNAYYRNIKVDMGNLILGLNYQYKYLMGRHSQNSNLQRMYGCLNIRYALSWQLTSNNLYRGFTNYITFTWGFEMFHVKRDY